jgi:hypothetical protein
MKDKNLLTEINRIKEMMGIQILSEQPIKEMMGIQLLSEQPKPLVNLLNSLAGLPSLRKFNRRILSLKNSLNINDIKKLFDEIKLDAKAADSVKKAITKFEENIVNRYKSIKYTNMIKDGLSKGKTEYEITNEIITDLKSVYGDFADGKVLDDFKLNISKRID